MRGPWFDRFERGDPSFEGQDECRARKKGRFQVTSQDSFGARGTLDVGGASYEVYRVAAAGDVGRLPYSLKILL